MAEILVTHDQVKPYIINGINTALSKVQGESELTYFDTVENQAAQILFDRTGYTADDKETILSWCIIPVAYIIQKLAKNLVSQLTPEFSESIEKDYETALAMIDEHPNESQDGPSDKSSSFVGLCDNMNDW